jgi:hypothetical protein
MVCAIIKRIYDTFKTNHPTKLTDEEIRLLLDSQVVPLYIKEGLSNPKAKIDKFYDNLVTLYNNPIDTMRLEPLPKIELSKDNRERVEAALELSKKAKWGVPTVMNPQTIDDYTRMAQLVEEGNLQVDCNHWVMLICKLMIDKGFRKRPYILDICFPISIPTIFNAVSSTMNQVCIAFSDDECYGFGPNGVIKDTLHGMTESCYQSMRSEIRDEISKKSPLACAVWAVVEKLPKELYQPHDYNVATKVWDTSTWQEYSQKGGSNKYYNFKRKRTTMRKRSVKRKRHFKKTKSNR